MCERNLENPNRCVAYKFTAQSPYGIIQKLVVVCYQVQSYVQIGRLHRKYINSIIGRWEVGADSPHHALWKWYRLLTSHQNSQNELRQVPLGPVHPFVLLYRLVHCEIQRFNLTSKAHRSRRSRRHLRYLRRSQDIEISLRWVLLAAKTPQGLVSRYLRRSYERSSWSCSS